MTTPSSTSQSLFSEPCGSTTGSWQPTMQLVGFMNSTGSLGTWAPVSAAWSE